MTTMIGNRRKPWRGYAAYNNLQACRLHVRQDAAIDPAEAKGSVEQVVLQPNKPFHFGTIPAGAFILAPSADVIVGLAGGGTLDVGTELDPDGILSSAAVVPATPGFKSNLDGGALLGYATEDLVLFATLSAAAATGWVDLVIPFYIHAD